jgi:DNA invertase Pin-like site-specific DNA recombinase
MNLSQQDIATIKKEMTGYGRVTEIASATKVHRTTLYKIVKRGSARESIISQLKTFLKLSANPNRIILNRVE